MTSDNPVSAPQMVHAAADESPKLTPAERVIARFLPSFADVLFVCVFAFGLLVLQGHILGVDGDAGWNIALGVMTLRHGLPRAEPFLSTMLGQPVVHWEWLTQVVYGLGYLFGGLNGVVAIAALLVALTVRGLYVILRRRGLSTLPAVALTFAGAALIALSWTARAQLFSLALTLWWSEWLWRYWQDGARRRLWAFPVVAALWANFHAGYFAGFALLGVATTLAWLLPPSRRKAHPLEMSLALVASVLATAATPWGFGYWRHVLAFMRNPLIPRLTEEYQSPNFHIGLQQLYLVMVFLLVGAWLVTLWRARGRGVTLLGLCVCGLWTALGFIYVRFVPLWPVVCFPYLADALAGAWSGVSHLDAGAYDAGWRGRIVGGASRLGQRVAALSGRIDGVERLVRGGLWSVVAIALAAALVAAGGTLPGQSRPLLHAQWDASALPVAAAQRLAAEGLPAGRGFNPYEWGGYLDFALPEYHVFIDSRSDVYSSQFMADYLAVVDLTPGWQKILDRYQIQWALLQTGSPLQQALASGGWRCHPEDTQGVATLCLRNDQRADASAPVARVAAPRAYLPRRAGNRGGAVGDLAAAVAAPIGLGRFDALDR